MTNYCLQSSQPVTTRLNCQPITSWLHWRITSTTRVFIPSTDVLQITWLWWWLPLRLSKRQSILTHTRTIVLHLVMIWPLVSNRLQLNVLFAAWKCHDNFISLLHKVKHHCVILTAVLDYQIFCWQAFTGSGFRLDGKKKKSNASSDPVPMRPPVIKRYVSGICLLVACIASVSAGNGARAKQSVFVPPPLPSPLASLFCSHPQKHLLRRLAYFGRLIVWRVSVSLNWRVYFVPLSRGIPNYNFEKGKITFKRNLNRSNNSQVIFPCILKSKHF